MRTETHQDAARIRSQACVVETARLVGRAFVSVTIAFLGPRRRVGASGSKKKGVSQPTGGSRTVTSLSEGHQIS